MNAQSMLVWLKIVAPPGWMIGKLTMAKFLVLVIACEMLILHLRYTELDSVHHQELRPLSPMTNEEPMDDDMPDEGFVWPIFELCAELLDNAAIMDVETTVYDYLEGGSSLYRWIQFWRLPSDLITSILCAAPWESQIHVYVLLKVKFCTIHLHCDGNYETFHVEIWWDGATSSDFGFDRLSWSL